MRKTKTSIIILTYNKLEYTKLCINSIRYYTAGNDYEIIVIDNGSTDNTAEWLKQQNDIISICNKANKGFSGGCNQGIKIATGTEILLLNNDTIVVPNWLSNLKKALYSSNKIGAVGPVSNNCTNWQTIEVEYNSNNLSEIVEFGKAYNCISDNTRWYLKVKLVGYCMLIKKEVIDKIGLLDEQFFPGNFEDDDYSLRILQADYKLLQCSDTFIHHFGNISFKDNDEIFRKNLLDNHKRFVEKWKINAVYSSRDDDILDNLNINPQTRLLEVECSCGAWLAEVKRVSPTTNVYGIDINKNSVDIARKIFPITCGDIETMELPYNEKFFDYIILQNVLPRIKNPIKLLKKLARYIKDDGLIVLSCYNFMHYSNIEKILSGKLDYEDNLWEGAFAENNIRVFNLNMLRTIVKKSNLQISFCVAPVKESMDKNINNNLVENILKSQLVSGKSEWELKAYKYIMHLKKKNLSNVGKRKLNNKKIEFITCVNNIKEYELCVKCIRNLKIPSDYNVEITPVLNASSMAQGYNKGMLKSDAKYKVYLHQDVRIINKNFIYDILRLFNKSSKIGLIGVVGAKKIPDNGVWWEAKERYGCLIHNPGGVLFEDRFEEQQMTGEYEEVQAIDGNLMITQYDIYWREDLFKGWHFYDTSQSMEFAKKGYTVIVPNIMEPWNIHECGINPMNGYDIDREILVKEYEL
ncbi:glycosyltransferase [Pectinatus brassicae]|uniref:GT2 family glycosyltransferase n=1 Tax=Pectinatus brassicae TaxID=862415 RepID=A0A840UGG4_9FIRM|nr:glycosyltransferase [Pectinatus brassicae]MBB5336841.1 GT2 family glycosyltransferase [Pectinatus brassicae]